MKNNFSVILAMKQKKIVDVKEATGLSNTTLTDIYYQRTNPNAITLIKIANYLDCSIDELLARKPFVVSG